MNKIIMIACMVLFTMSAQAQRNQNRNNATQVREEKTNVEVYTQRAEQYADQWELTPETGAKFINLYIEWQQNRMNIIDKYGIDQKAGADINFKKISEDDADKLVSEDFDRLTQQAEVDKQYYEKFKEIITPAHAAQVIVQQRNRAAGMMSQFRNMMNGGGGRAMRGMMMF